MRLIRPHSGGAARRAPLRMRAAAAVIAPIVGATSLSMPQVDLAANDVHGSRSWPTSDLLRPGQDGTRLHLPTLWDPLQPRRKAPWEARQSPHAPPGLVPLETRYLGQLTSTTRNGLGWSGINGLDLGFTLVRDGKAALLFGDSGGSMNARDPVAFFGAPFTADEMPELSFHRSPMGLLQPVDIPGVTMDGMNVPVEAIPIGEETYLFVAAEFDHETQRYGASVLAKGRGFDFANMSLVHRVPSEKFINIQAVQSDGYLYLYGSGDYRKSAIHLARVRPEALADRDAWEYYRPGPGGRPEFVPGEANAAPLIDERTVGELSVRYDKGMGAYVMLWGSENPPGIQMSLARSPVGPWSPPVQIFDPFREGFGEFIHSDPAVLGFQDGAGDGHAPLDQSGGAYGPQILFFGERDGRHVIRWTVSSWRPYQVHMMETVLGEPGDVAPPRLLRHPPQPLQNPGFTEGLSGWKGDLGAFTVQPGGDAGAPVTLRGNGAAGGGRLWQEFVPDADHSVLEFRLRGEHARVDVWYGPDRIKRVEGRRDGDRVRLDLSDYTGQRLMLVLADTSWNGSSLEVTPIDVVAG